MPLYEYRCLKCEQRTERLVPYELAGQPGPCPACAGERRRLFSRVGVKLNGWGFGANDQMVADRPGRGDFAQVAERAERISEGE
ncbi:MAG: putative FmdB family regulatory protein [Glaciecola sp.]